MTICAPPVFEGSPELSPPPVDFAWAEFQQGRGQFDVQDATTKWKYISSTDNSQVRISVYSRKLNLKGGLPEFLLRGTLPISRDDYFALNADMEYRDKWDTTTLGVTVLSSDQAFAFSSSKICIGKCYTHGRWVSANTYSGKMCTQTPVRMASQCGAFKGALSLKIMRIRSWLVHEARPVLTTIGQTWQFGTS